ncbi:Pyridoxal 5'-phosphate synthase [Purpureocillium takamizusanense]|uniref:pyridoxal 5'-phosphate synthase n=1 Tax=Purpureocillium takamizusanense TaxID=2060973 RepID=A0A9Q8VCP3_9HYPO|nr:Pyridoxal 5'-phosphate synthase [Purpureocillium takamizusanense]UNI21860.1 Pyridoxal 5'-phosphate synthase [Purpureocillium takamizusanense]
MALYQPPVAESQSGAAAPPEKLIFAPAGSQAHGQAAQFTRGTLSRRDLVSAASPAPQFHAWFTEAQATPAIAQPEACALSTAELPSGRVSSRLVYLKELDAGGGFVVYSNLETSRKARDLATNPHAALVWYWPALQRQVRVEGRAERYPRDQSQAYFDTRVRGSRIGAWASRQSQVLVPKAGGDGGGDGARVGDVDNDGHGDDDGRAQLEEWVAEAERRFEGRDDIPVPDFWGGLRIVPDRVEFWQGRESRLHDRFVYELQDGGEPGEEAKWTVARLSP